ncbi:MAG: phosphocholine cytidylyltransferase family protein [Nanoarchaeota archaeon]
MKAIILAAGMSRRLEKLTENKPKCLLEVDNKPILAYQLEALMANGVNNIVIVVGYKGFMIKDFIKKHPIFKDWRVVFIENDEYADSNTSYSWWLAREHIKNEQSIFHLHSDLIFFPALVRKVLEDKRKNIICIDKKIPLNESMEQVILDKENKIIHMDKSNVSGAHGKAVGVAKFSNEAIIYKLDKIKSYVQLKDKNQAFYGIIREAVKDLDYYGLDIGDSFFREVNTTDEYNIALESLRNGRI